MDPREWMFDKRVLRRNLDKGALTWKAYKEYLKGLDDQEAGADTLEIESRARADGAADGRDAGRSGALE
ncbi:MAG: hypothetical protein M0R80_06780 [Proteobacteria bacterium]|jgi:hypothetical protein|nr:hypothetical protein [Pseudomonadota bacterium]